MNTNTTYLCIFWVYIVRNQFAKLSIFDHDRDFFCVLVRGTYCFSKVRIAIEMIINVLTFFRLKTL